MNHQRRALIGAILLAVLVCGGFARARDQGPDPVTDSAYAPPTPTTEIEALKQRFMDVAAPDAERASASIKALLAYGKPEIIPALIAGLRDGAAPRQSYVAALQQLTGVTQPLNNWYEWAIWQQKQRDWPENPAFDAVFSERTSQVDSGYRALLPPATALRVPTHDLIWDGSFLDQAGVIDRPIMAHASRAQQITGNDVVIALPAYNGEKARAWPLKLLAGETIINDVWAGIPIAISYHPVCGTVLVFDRRMTDNRGDVQALLRPTGLLHRGRPLLYSREHNGLWNGCTGQSLTQRPALDNLRLLPATTTSWTKWAAANPDSLVMVDDRPTARAEAMVERLKTYHSTEKLPWPVAIYDDRYDAKEKFVAVTAPDNRLIGVELLSNLAQRPVMNARYGDVPVVIVTENNHIPTVRVFRRQDQMFEPMDYADGVRDQNGGVWHIHEGGLIGPNQQILERLPSYSAYWYVFQDMLPELAQKPAKLDLPKRPYGTIISPAPKKPLALINMRDGAKLRRPEDPVPFGMLRFPPPPRAARPVYLSASDEAGIEPMPGPLPRIERLRLARQPSIIPPRQADEKIVLPHEKPHRPDISGHGH